MDYATLAGLLLALAGILGGQLIEGGHAGSLAQGAAFLIVFCGTAGAVMVQTQPRVFFEGVRMGRWALLPPPPRGRALIAQVVEWSALSRREGLLGLEARVHRLADAFARKG